VLAGADMVMVLWYPEKKREVRDALLEAAASGRIPAWRLDQAVRRVLAAKAKRGLFTTELLPIKTALRELERAQRDVVPEVARRAITLVKNQGNVLPLRRGQVVAVAATEPVFVDELRRTLRARGVVLPVGTTRERIDADAARLIELAAGADVVVVGMQSAEHRAVVERVRVAYPDVPIVVVSFGTPYVLAQLPRVEAYLCAFGWRDESERAAAAALTARVSGTGTLPVDLAGGPRLGAR
jgi:beta-N-acetylhexosaminidase